MTLLMIIAVLSGVNLICAAACLYLRLCKGHKPTKSCMHKNSVGRPAKSTAEAKRNLTPEQAKFIRDAHLKKITDSLERRRPVKNTDSK